MRVDKKIAEQLEFETGNNNKEYEVESIYNYAVYAKDSKVRHLLGFYYLVSWKDYPKYESTWKYASEV